MVIHDAGSAVGFRAADKELQTPHRHPPYLSHTSRTIKGAPHLF